MRLEALPKNCIIYISPQPVVKNVGSTHILTVGGKFWGTTEETDSNPLKSNPVKSEGKIYNIDTLEQEIDSLKQIVAQQNRVMQRLGANLQTPQRLITTKLRDIPILELHQLQGLNESPLP